NVSTLFRSALVASAIVAAALVTPASAFVAPPTNHLSDAPVGVGGILWNPKIMVEAGVPTEEYGNLALTRSLVITTDRLEGVGNTSVVVQYAGISRHVNLIPNGKSQIVDFGAT